MRIALIPNFDKPDAVAAARDIVPLMAGHTTQTVTDADPARQLGDFHPDLIVVLGGDGTILRIASALNGLDAPVVGINFGKLGYLAAFYLDQFKTHLPVILSGKAPISNRLMLQGFIYHCNPQGAGHDGQIDQLLALKPDHEGLALNDVVINSGPPFRMVELHVRIDNCDTTTFRSDGMIVATASGSTGYNLSSGGPLLSPHVNAFALTPICPHSLSFRPVIIPDTATLVVHPHRLNPGTAVSFDGQTLYKFDMCDILLVRKAPNPLRLIESPTMSHWQMLAQKLHWAQSPQA